MTVENFSLLKLAIIFESTFKPINLSARSNAAETGLLYLVM